MKKTLDRYSDILWTLSAICFFLIFAVNIGNMFCRTFLRFSLLWSFDFSMLMIAWSMCMAMATAVYRYDHLVVTFVVDLLPWRIRKVLSIFTRVILLSICVLVAYEGLAVTSQRMGVLFTILRWPTGFAFAALPMFGFSSALFLFYNLIQAIKDFKVPPVVTETEAVAKMLAEADEMVEIMETEAAAAKKRDKT